MQTIGERLLEARKQKGISVREAAEVLKVRTEFLSSFENDKFDIDLPEIYVVGFLQNYAKYLKLDDEKVLVDFQALKIGENRRRERDRQEPLFPRQDPPPPHPAKEKKAASSRTGDSLGRIPVPESQSQKESSRPLPPKVPVDSSPDEENGEENERDFGIYLKAGFALISTIIIIFAGIVAIKLIFSGSPDPGIVPPPPTITGNTGTSTGTTTIEEVARETIILVATGDVRIRVRKTSDGEVLYRDLLMEGDRYSIEMDEPIEVAFDRGENLVIERESGRLAPSRSGVGRMILE